MDLQPHLTGELVELRPLRAADWEQLYPIASDPLIWEQHPAHDRYREPVFRQYFDGAVNSGGAFLVLDKATQQPIGCTRFCNFDAEKRELEIGWTFLARSHWGGRYNSEMKRLMLDYAFQFVDAVHFVVGVTNFRSQRAVEKLGAVRVRFQDEMNDGKAVQHVVFELRKP